MCMDMRISLRGLGCSFELNPVWRVARVIRSLVRHTLLAFGIGKYSNHGNEVSFILRLYIGTAHEIESTLQFSQKYGDSKVGKSRRTPSLRQETSV